MSVSEDLLCSFELLKVGRFAQQRLTKEVAYRSLTLMLSQPLDGAALKKEMAKNKRKR